MQCSYSNRFLISMDRSERKSEVIGHAAPLRHCSAQSGKRSCTGKLGNDYWLKIKAEHMCTLMNMIYLWRKMCSWTREITIASVTRQDSIITREDTSLYSISCRVCGSPEESFCVLGVTIVKEQVWRDSGGGNVGSLRREWVGNKKVRGQENEILRTCVLTMVTRKHQWPKKSVIQNLNWDLTV